MRCIPAFCLFTLLIVVPAGVGSPIDGMFSMKSDLNDGVWTATRTFRGGERAAVLVDGSSGPTNLEVSVFNAAKELVAFDKADGSMTGNVVGAIWYPPVDGEYRIVVRHPDAAQIYVAVK